jgi:hypothetical protein
MNPAHDRVYRKTERGAAALKTRSSSLPARARTALILVNGVDSVASLVGKIGPDAAVLVELLLELGLVEEVPAARPVRAAPVAATPVMPAVTPTVATTAPTAVTPAAAIDSAAAEAMRTRLAPLKHEVIQRLEPHFGPDTDVVCAALVAAATEEAYRDAIVAIESKLSAYLGRKGAQRMLDGLRYFN